MRPHTISLFAFLSTLPLLIATCGHAPPPSDAPVTPETDAPRARLRLSGQLEGRLEPCGCASGQVGGLARRSFRVQQDRGKYDFLIEGGDLVVDGSALDELKLLTILNVLDDGRARYDAVGVGSGELGLPIDLLTGYQESFDRLPFVCADIVAKGDEPWPMRASVDLVRDSARVRVTGFATAVPGPEQAGERRFELLDAPRAWARAMDGVPDDALRILLHHGSSAAARAAAKLTPQPDLIVVVNPEHTEPPHEFETVDGVPLVFPGIRGRYLLDLTLARIDGKPGITHYEPIALEGSRTAKDALRDKDVDALILAHRNEVAEDGTLERMAERESRADGLTYAGTNACASCHHAANEVWEKSKHAIAWETLEKAQERGRYAWPVHRYPDCVACHSVGYGTVSGFVNPERTPQLESVGCESCHGPSAAHAKNPLDNKTPGIAADTCLRCHDFEQSPSFDYNERWKAIEHR